LDHIMWYTLLLCLFDWSLTINAHNNKNPKRHLSGLLFWSPQLDIESR
jgi:hypothetical protein